MADRFTPCSVPGCKGSAHYTDGGRRGWCKLHYSRVKTHGDPNYQPKPPTLGCSIEGCDGAHFGRGYCHAHYIRFWRHGDPLAGRTSPGELENYYREVVVPYDGQDCLIWPYGRDSNGYGVIGHGTVHSRLCEDAHGPKPTPDHEVAHKCGKGHEGCVAKRHLRWATRAENQADKVIHGTSLKGEANPNRKLTEDEVAAIRALRGRKTQHQIAAMFGIDQTTVSDVQRRRTWAWM